MPLIAARQSPRSLIAAMVEVVAPQPGETICDPSCGTGGFLLAAHDHIAKHHQLDRDQKKQLKSGTFHGIELVDSVTRLCAMNLLLHGIGDGGSGVSPLDATTANNASDEKGGVSGEGNHKRQDAASTFDLPVITKDALAGKHGEYEIVLANPPFGKKSSVTIVNDAGESSKESLVINRDDFWASTSNKQLNFLQHIFTILKMHGRAAVVLPDNVLFEGGAGETIRRELLKQADVHTLLRLPTGIFYAQGVKANVLFFDRKPAQEKPWTRKLWIYDLRTNMHFTLKENPLKREHLDDFVACYFGGTNVDVRSTSRHERQETERFKAFDYEEPDQARQDQPRHLLAQRRVPRRIRQPPRSRRDRPRHHGRPASRSPTVRHHRGGFEGMSAYGDAAVDAARLCQKQGLDPVAAWTRAVEKHLPTEEGRKKSCPKSTFLGLCEEGLIKEVPAGSYTRSKLNKGYALRALQLLNAHPALASSSGDLWRKVMAGEPKKPNGQMEVVIALWSAGMGEAR
jgi:hypothetical protein|nr:N-6 DNA methylase [Prosthecobacter sp.]